MKLTGGLERGNPRKSSKKEQRQGKGEGVKPIRISLRSGMGGLKKKRQLILKETKGEVFRERQEGGQKGGGTWERQLSTGKRDASGAAGLGRNRTRGSKGWAEEHREPSLHQDLDR